MLLSERIPAASIRRGFSIYWEATANAMMQCFVSGASPDTLRHKSPLAARYKAGIASHGESG